MYSRTFLLTFSLLLVATIASCGWFDDVSDSDLTPASEPTPTATDGRQPDPSPTPAVTSSPIPTPQPTPTPTQPPVAEDVITIRELETSDPVIALTFDAGADRGYAGEILDTLREEGITATFGITGIWAEANPDLILRVHEEGHTLINHTYDHPSFTGFSTSQAPLTTEERLSQLQRTEQIMADILGDEHMRPYFRPPYGDYDVGVLADIAGAGYTVNVMWSVDSLGWQGLTAAEIADRCVDGATPGGILLFHVGAQSQDAAALPDIIRRLRDQGYRFVTVQEMIGR